MKTTIALLLLAFMLIASCFTGCQYFPGVTVQGHISARYMIGDSIPVVVLLEAHGDTVNVATTIDVYSTIPDIYFQALDDRDSVLRRRVCTTPPAWALRDTTAADTVCQVKLDTDEQPTGSLDRDYGDSVDVITVVRTR